MDGRPTWTDCDEAGDYVVPNVLSPKDLVFRPDNMDKTVSHTSTYGKRSLRNAAPVLWNSLPDDFRNCSNFNQFKGLILSWNGKNVTVLLVTRSETP